MIKVLMTGAGAPGGPGIIKALQIDPEIDLIVGDINPEASGKFLNKKFELLLSAEDPLFVSDLLRICIKNEIEIVFPLVTKELLILSEFKSIFLEHGIKIIVSEYNSLEIANNKSYLYGHLKSNNIRTPKFKVASTFSDVIEGFIELGYPKVPICIKPSISNGSRGVRIIDDSINEFELLFKHKPNSLYMAFDKLKEILSENDFPEILISEFLPGEEFTIDTIVSQGDPVVVLPRLRSKMNGGISVAGRFIEDLAIIEYCKEIIYSLKLDGPIGLQVKKATDGTFKILEINPRIQGTSVAALGLGVNLPLLSIYNAMGVKIETPLVKWNTHFVRYYSELFY